MGIGRIQICSVCRKLLLPSRRHVSINPLATQRNIPPPTRDGAMFRAYPRLETNPCACSIKGFRETWDTKLKNGDREDAKFILRGRVKSVRVASSKLFFYTITDGQHEVQILFSIRQFLHNQTLFNLRRQTVHRGDTISVGGVPMRSDTGELSLLATDLATILSPCTHTAPRELTETSKRFANRHLDLRINEKSREILRVRSLTTAYLRSYFHQHDFVEVETPILAGAAGGANASPFETKAKALGKTLALRIAPELWLKRLIVGDMDRIFEIGKCFRNEGIDATHSPEFTTCEYYEAYANLDDLIQRTEELLSGLVAYLCTQSNLVASVKERTNLDCSTPFARLDFHAVLENELKQPLPDLESPESIKAIEVIFNNHHLPHPTPATVPRFLERLSNRFLESKCIQPTLIMNIPSCMSPLAKSSRVHGRHISHRFELFVQGRELINAYEEENSPEEQRQKLLAQQHLRDDFGDYEACKIDESFVGALEWGMPPTAGWGIGIDRLLMLLCGEERIAEVTTFGAMTSVFGQGVDRGKN